MQTVSNHSPINDQIQGVISSYDGSISEPRGQKVCEYFMKTLEIDPLKPLINYEERPFNFKYFTGELYWYLIKDRNPDKVLPYSKFWDKLRNVDKTVNSNYGHFMISDQYAWVKNSLIKDVNTRQAIAFYNRPEYQYESNKDFICTLYQNFWIRDNKLNMKVQMRSCDIVRGLTYDAPWFSLVMQSLYLDLKTVYPELEIGTYYHVADNLHYYEMHFDTIEKMSKSGSDKDFRFVLREPLFEINCGTTEITESAKKFCILMSGVNGRDDFDYKNALSTIIDII